MCVYVYICMFFYIYIYLYSVFILCRLCFNSFRHLRLVFGTVRCTRGNQTPVTSTGVLPEFLRRFTVLTSRVSLGLLAKSRRGNHRLPRYHFYLFLCLILGCRGRTKETVLKSNPLNTLGYFLSCPRVYTTPPKR